MSNPPPADPVPPVIMVNADPMKDQVETGLRYLLLALGAIAGALGWTRTAGTASALMLAVGPVAMLVAFVWGQVKTRTLSRKASTMAAHLPDSVAQTK